MNEGTILYCPKCQALGELSILGKVNNNLVWVKRIRRNMPNGTTVIQFTGTVYLGCQCGYGTVIASSGKAIFEAASH